ncbi:MAG TPA: carbohydrate kinase, partial [Opitutae bacterium]|nr:carbohydrate kinase [Opitutae bacterium]
MPYTLGIDASTQSCSALIIDTDSGTIVSEVSVNFGKDLPQYQAPSGFITNGENGEVHADPLMWLDALEQLLDLLSKTCDLSKITAISGAGQQHGSVYLNDRWFDVVDTLDSTATLAEQLAPCLSRKTSPIWMDSSTNVECAEITASVGGDQRVCEKSGSIAVERFTGPQIRRFYKTDPDAFSNTARIHLVSSFLCSLLSGIDAPIDTGDGAGMNLLNIQNWHWDDQLLEATAPNLLNSLPEVATGNTTV